MKIFGENHFPNGVNWINGLEILGLAALLLIILIKVMGDLDE